MELTHLLSDTTVRLTACTTADLPTITCWHSDGAFLRLWDALPAQPKTEQALANWLDAQHKASDSFVLGVRLHDSDELIGIVELNGILWTHQVGWLAIAIGAPQHQGQGYGSAALDLALRFAFWELNLFRVQLTVFSYNQRATSLYEKHGFQCEGVYRQFLQRDNQRFDMLLYGLLRHEWHSQQPAPSS